MPEAKPDSPSVLKAGIFGVVIFGFIAFAVVAFNTSDILWFWPVFKATPVQIAVNCYGKDMQVEPGTNAFIVVNAAVNSSLTGYKRWDETTMSQTTYQEYQTSSSVMVLMLHYDPPATIHSQYAFMKSVDWLVIPLVGRHADTYAVFGIEGKYIDPGSYHIKNTIQIVNALQEQDICAKQ
jgi:hypothetical protein